MNPVRGLIHNVSEVFFSLCTMISPRLNTKLRYRRYYHCKLNLQNPQSFIEKLLWLKINIYDDDPLVAQCVDKYRVREYVKKCGCQDILNDLIGVYNSAFEIPWDELPKQFVLKWNFGATMNIICSDKNLLSKDSVVNQMAKWGQCKYWLSHAEMQYKGMKKCIVCEKFLGDGKPLTDYKVYCFHGKPEAIFVMSDRGHQIKTEFFDTEWNRLENTGKYLSPEIQTRKPSQLDRLLQYAADLSAPFPFVRCDFYIINERIYFGELTFTPAGGLYTSQTKIHGKDMADFIDLKGYMMRK